MLWVNAIIWTSLMCCFPCYKSNFIQEEPFLYNPINEEGNFFWKFLCLKTGITGTLTLSKESKLSLIKASSILLLLIAGYFGYKFLM